jgi:hypothetical protein
VPSCRFWYFRVKNINSKMRRRRGKPLVATPYIEENDDRNQEFRCQVRREQPFRSTSNDVAQATSWCNVDFQFLFCAPPLPATATPPASRGVLQPAAVAGADEAAPEPLPKQKKRLTKKTPDLHRRKTPDLYRRPALVRKLGDCPAWFPSAGTLSIAERVCIKGFAASFQKAAAMDFYITKYQSKPMEILTPLLMPMTGEIHRLEKQEEQEEAEAQAGRQAAANQDGDASQPAKKKPRKTLKELQRRARRVTIRIASMANRCFWLSSAEVAVHILTDGDCLQSHKNMRIFTRQLQWAMQQCKRLLNHEAAEGATDTTHQTVQAVSFHVTQDVQDEQQQHEEDHASESDVDFDKLEACTTSTNTADDYAHRGRTLRTMPYYVYRMYVHRILRPPRAKATAPNIFHFEPHYALARTYVQEVALHSMHVPTIDGFQCPTVDQDAEQNALLKSLLFTPWSCTDPMQCGSAMNFRHFLSNGNSDASQLASSSSGDVVLKAGPQRCFTFARAWRLRRSELQVLADRADSRSAAAQKWLVLADTTTFAEQNEPLKPIEAGEDTKTLLQQFCCRQLHRIMPMQGARLILAFLDLPSKWHDEQCSLAEFSAFVARDVIAHIDLAAEARVKKPRRTVGDAASECEDSDSDAEPRARNTIGLVDIGGGDDDGDEVSDDVPLNQISRFPLEDITRALSLCLQQEDIEALSTKSRKSQADLDLKDVHDTYAGLLKQSFGLQPASTTLEVRGFGNQHKDMLALQKKTIARAKK